MSSTLNAEQAEDVYFSSNPAPKSLAQTVTIVREFVSRHANADRRVALVTSGGTTVPLENQTVRYIDNFSAGTRGATSAEYFLAADYAVIFLHRQFSLLPYSRHYSHNTNSFLDFMREDEHGKVVVIEEQQEEMLQMLRQYTAVKSSGRLLILSFTTVNEYLWTLRELAKLMQPLGARALFYLAAAVSDFFVPHEKMVEHKIQSNDEFTKHNAQSDGTRRQAARTEGSSLIIDLDPVPKFLKRLVDAWAPNAIIVSFKLETDPSLLEEKAKYALQKYAHHLVIGNLLTTRKWEVVMVSPQGVKWIRVPRGRRTKSFSGVESLVGQASGTSEMNDIDAHKFVGEPPVEIESMIIPEIADLQNRYIADCNKSK